MSTVTIFGFPPSTYTRTARIAAIEKGATYDLRPLDYGADSHFALHPFGKMPILAHGDERVFETLAILAYLDSTFEGPSLFPDAPADYVRSMAAISAAIDYVYRPVVHNEAKRGRNAGGHSGGEAARAELVVETTRPASLLRGDTASAADYVLGPMLAFGEGATADDGRPAEYPSLRRWLDAMMDRPSFQATRPDA